MLFRSDGFEDLACENADCEDCLHCMDYENDCNEDTTFEEAESESEEEKRGLYIHDMVEAEKEINTRNSSGTSLERLKRKFPNKNFI